jgi:hypothetical protein
MEKRTFCQSCGMPLKKDPKGGGTNAHGTRSLMYCSYCYLDGHFVSPDMTLDQMKTLVVTTLHKKGMPTFVARLVAGNLRRMERWRTAG